MTAIGSIDMESQFVSPLEWILYVSAGLLTSFLEIWQSLDPYYFEQVSQFARNWLQRRIDYARRQYRASDNYLRESVERDLLELENQIPDMKYPWED